LKAKGRFPEPVVASIREGKVLRIRAGAEHRFIGIWVVVVEDRVFVRSWSVKPRGWYRAFLQNPRGAILVDGREIPVRAVRRRGEDLKDAISRAYLEKYGTRSSIKYARDMGRPKSRATTTELVPARPVAPSGKKRR
jgi:hypothetical protein